MDLSRRMCKFYRRGYCKFGSRCRNFHQRKGLEASSKAFVFGDNSKMEPSTTLNGRVPQNCKKTCGICFDKILDKKLRKQHLFGILPNCNHCFCFTCIRRWRQSKDFDIKVARGCPECRTISDFVYPSRVWFENKAEKDDFITKEKARMQKINCRYFRKGRGKCPFGNTCLYLHALPNGKKLDVGPPNHRRRRTSTNSDFEDEEVVHWLNEDDNDEFFDLDNHESFMRFRDRDLHRIIALQQLMNAATDDETDDVEFTLFL